MMMRLASMLSAFSLLLLVASVSCQTAEVAAPQSSAELCAFKDRVLAEIPARTIDDDFEILARLLPGGFGGLTSTYIYLKQPELAGSMRDAARILLGCPGTAPSYLIYIKYVADVRAGQYDWVELRGWYRTLLGDRTVPMSLADMDEGINRLRFDFRTDAELQAFRARAQMLGVPAGALSLAVNDWIVTLDRRPPGPH